jgi:hypothetical protein
VLLVGVAGGEFGVRGFVQAFDEQTGCFQSSILASQATLPVWASRATSTASSGAK